MSDQLRRADWFVANASIDTARAMVQRHHYARGATNTATFLHGLYRAADKALCGVAWWLPPTRVACESVNREHWRLVLSLTRLVLLPEVPTNGASFLMARSIDLIRKDGRFRSLVTYADESQGHTGAIYRATNWDYAGRTGAEPRWLDSDGRQVSRKAGAVSRTAAEMQALGYTREGKSHKHKFVMHLPARAPRLRATQPEQMTFLAGAAA